MSTANTVRDARRLTLSARNLAAFCGGQRRFCAWGTLWNTCARSRYGSVEFGRLAAWRRLGWIELLGHAGRAARFELTDVGQRWIDATREQEGAPCP